MFREVPTLQLARKDGCGVDSSYTTHYPCFIEVSDSFQRFHCIKSILASRKGEAGKMYQPSVAFY